MSLPVLIRDAVARIKTAAGSTFVDVVIEPYAGQDGDGKRSYGTPVTRPAFLERKQVAVRHGILGYETVDAQVLTFAENVIIDAKDRITLPDGSQPPIESVSGPADPAGGYYIAQVMFGRPERGNLL